jgi:hypothetical protein
MWTGWYKTPDGQSMFVTEARRMEFLRRYHLSESTRPSQVWDILSESAAKTEEDIFTVIEGGRAMGRDAKDIGKDLETFIRYEDGGERVKGRWMSMVSPYKADGTRDEKKIREGWERAYIEKLNEGKDVLGDDWVAYGSYEAKRILQEPRAAAWIQQESIGKSGKTLLPPGARAYSSRLGKAGLDYRAIRVLRTESAVSFNERQDRLAETSPASTGKVMRKLDEHRDSWHCECQEAARACRDDGGWGPSEIPEKWRVPLHPNCLTAGTIIKTLRGNIPIEEVTVSDFVMGDSGKFRRVLKVHHSLYTGKIFAIEPRGMIGISLTHNHPVFVYRRGWIEAQNLKKGDKLITSYSMPLCPNIENLPPVLCQIVKFFLVLGYLSGRIMPAAAVYFDGYHSFRYGKVDIENTNWIQRDSSNSIVGKKLKKNNLIDRHFSFFRDTVRSFLASINRLMFSTQSIMSRLYICYMSEGISPLYSFADVRGSYAVFNKEIADCSPGETELCSNRFNRESFIKKVKSFIWNSNFFRRHFKPCVIDGCFDSVDTASNCRSNFWAAQSLFQKFKNLFIKFCFMFHIDRYYRIVSVKSSRCYEKTDFPVYNLSVDIDNDFFANGVLVHNCMCQDRPIMKDVDDFIDEVLKEYGLDGGEPKYEPPEHNPGPDDLSYRAGYDTEKPGDKDDFITVKMPGASDDIEFAKKVERDSVNYSHLSYQKAIKTEAKWLMDNGQRTGNEFLSFLSDKKVMGTWEGIGKITKIKIKEIDEALKNHASGSVDCLHCHLGYNLQSPEDLDTMCKIKKIGRMTVTLPNGEQYYVSVGDGRRPVYDDIDAAWQYFGNRIEAEEKKRLGVDTLLPNQEIEVNIKLMRVICTMFGWRFGKII